MKKLLISILFCLLTISVFSQAVVITADHTVLDEYYNIPDRWIDSINTKLVWIHGASHAAGLYNGFDTLAKEDPRLNVKIWFEEDPPPAAQDDSLRIGRPFLGGHNVMTNWEYGTGRENLERNIIGDYNTDSTNNQYDFWMYGWSYEQGVWGDTADTRDPVYDVPWAGSSQSGFSGDTIWGLDSADYDITGNRYSMEAHIYQLDTLETYMRDNSYDTRIIYSTGVADGNSGTARGFQRALKNQYMRDSLSAKSNIDTVYFFDYEDILVWNGDSLYTVDWDDGGTIRSHRQMHPDNNTPNNLTYEDHTGDIGALRLAKGFAWLMARSMGWDGITTSSDTSIHVMYCQDSITNPNASDLNTGYDFNFPKATMQAVIDATEGTDIDTIYFRSGVDSIQAGEWVTYDPDNGFGYGVHGKDSLTFLTWDTDTFYVDGTNSTNGENIFNVGYTGYFKIKGNFIFQNKQQEEENDIIRQLAFYNNDNLWIEGVVSRNSGGYGFTINAWDTLYLINCDSYENYDWWMDGVTYIPGNKADGFAISSGGETTDYGYVQGCRAWLNSDDGMEYSPATEFIIDSVWVFANGYDVGGLGVGIKYGPGYIAAAGSRVTKHCISAYNKGPSFAFQNLTHITNGPIGEFYNNLSYKTQSGFQAAVGDFDCTIGDGAMVLNNNLFYDHTGASYYAQTWFYGLCMNSSTDLVLNFVTGSNNTFYIDPLDESYFWSYNDTISWAETGKDAQWVSLPDSATTLSVLSAARKSGGYLPDIGNYFKLASTSDLIDAGTDVGLSYDGSAPDLGPFEYEAQSPAELPTVLTGQVKQITKSGCVIEVNNNDDGGGTVTAKGVCWNTTGTPTTADDYTDEGGGAGEFDSSITGLTEGTTYYVRAYATNEAGTDYGSQITFETPANLPLRINDKLVTLPNGMIIKW